MANKADVNTGEGLSPDVVKPSTTVTLPLTVPATPSKPPPTEIIVLDANTFKDYLLLTRRALLQNVAADERMLETLDAITLLLSKMSTPTESIPANAAVTVDNALIQVFKTCVIMLRKNTDERRKALLQIVRDIEKRYALPNKKKRGRS